MFKKFILNYGASRRLSVLEEHIYKVQNRLGIIIYWIYNSNHGSRKTIGFVILNVQMDLKNYKNKYTFYIDKYILVNN